MMQKLLTYLCLPMVLMACSTPHSPHKQATTPLSVRTCVVRAADASAVNHYVGTVESVHETPLSMQMAGRVLAVPCKNGDRVRRGQVLLRVDSTQAVNALRSAEASLRYAEDGYNRLRQVHGAGAVTDQKMVEVESQLAQARSLCDAARRQVQECELVAPCDGVVSGLDVAVGQTVMPGLQLLTILDLTAFQVRFTVPEAEIGRIRNGQTGEMDCAAVQRTYPVRLTDKGLTANRLAHTYDVTARIEGGQEVLRPGMVCKVRLRAGDTIAAADIVIPGKCVLLKPEGHSVWLKENGRAVRRPVSIGGYQANGVQILDGLHIGDSLIVEGYQKLYNDCQVRSLDD